MLPRLLLLDSHHEQPDCPVMRLTARIVLISVLLATGSPALIGCKSVDRPASASFASVRIEGHTPEQIQAATVVVFQIAEYTAADVRRSEMVFEREGSRWDQIAYGSWVNDASVWNRVRVSMVPLAADTFRLQCQAFKVRNKGDPLTEEEVRIGNSHRKHYQALLDKVVERLK